MAPAYRAAPPLYLISLRLTKRTSPGMSRVTLCLLISQVKAGLIERALSRQSRAQCSICACWASLFPACLTQHGTARHRSQATLVDARPTRNQFISAVSFGKRSRVVSKAFVTNCASACSHEMFGVRHACFRHLDVLKI